ncbi:MAG: glutathione peroxidase [Proteobacteria bacterium]|nr:glutathione peroxidase [Pseudomonadota bacterium]
MTKSGHESTHESIYNIPVKTIDGKEITLSQFKDKVLLIVNVASKCGFTPQYKGLEELYEQFHKKGLEVLGFPCNQFGSQEPGTEKEIQQFCSLTYNVTFPIFAKVDVNGPGTHPLYAYLKKAEPGILGTEGIKWNFTKFLVNKKGEVVKRYASATTPEALKSEIAALL